MAFCWLASLLAPSPSNVLLINHHFTQKWPVSTMFTLPVDIVFEKHIKHERHISTNPPKSKHILLCTSITLHPLQGCIYHRDKPELKGTPGRATKLITCCNFFYPFSNERGTLKKQLNLSVEQEFKLMMVTGQRECDRYMVEQPRVSLHLLQLLCTN